MLFLGLNLYETLQPGQIFFFFSKKNLVEINVKFILETLIRIERIREIRDLAHFHDPLKYF